jgi:catechol 2,3-dioxygenase-like lactoylglutathione lyase family enzyme
MTQHLGAVSLVVADYDEAKAWYGKVLGFDCLEDVDLGDGKRWITLAPRGSSETRLLLARAVGPEQTRAVGNQAGGRVFLFLYTDDFWRDHGLYRARGVKFCEEPRQEAYGVVAVFEDLYGNRWDLLEMRDKSLK